MKKAITGLIILGLGIGFPACLGIFLIETQNTEDNIIDDNNTDNFIQKEGNEKPSKKIPKNPIIATINVDPNALNSKSKGKWITVYITLASGYDVNDIAIATVKLNGELLAAPKFEILDINNDNCLDLMVKFDRILVKDIIVGSQESDTFTIIITGELCDGKFFEGTDIIKLIHF